MLVLSRHQTAHSLKVDHQIRFTHEDQSIVATQDRARCRWNDLTTPIDLDEQYAGMRLGFDADGLRVMELSDNLGQITQLKFASEQRDQELALDWFQFTVPPGVDIVEAPHE